MCLICVEIQKGSLSPKDFAERIQIILKEDPEHEEEIINALKQSDSKYLDNLEKYLMEKISHQLIDIVNRR